MTSNIYAQKTVPIQSRSMAKVTKLIGNAEISENNKWAKIKKDMIIKMYHRVRTSNKSRMELVFQDGSKLRMNENTNIILVESKKKEYSIFNLSAGQIWANITNNGKNKTSLKTNTAILAVMGTVFDVNLNSNFNKTEMSVFSGSVGVQPQQENISKIEESLNTLKLKEDKKIEDKKEIKKDKISKPVQIEKPFHIVPGPYKVSFDKWLEITENKKIIIDNIGNALVSNQENDKLKEDEWVIWNKTQDSN